MWSYSTGGGRRQDREGSCELRLKSSGDPRFPSVWEGTEKVLEGLA